MTTTTTCPKCGTPYEETCEELVNAPDRQCDSCFGQMIDEVDQDELDSADIEDERLDDPRHGQARDINKVYR